MEKKRRKNMHLKFYKKSLKDKNIPIELKKKLVVMLNEIIDVYYEVKPEDVKNFLPKDYCSIQFLKILNREKYISKFRNIRSVRNLERLNGIFKKICNKKQWDQWTPDTVNNLNEITLIDNEKFSQTLEYSKDRDFKKDSKSIGKTLFLLATQ